MEIINLNPGPSALPIKVLSKASESIVNYNQSGLSILSISHRSKDFANILANANTNVYTLLNLNPEEYSVLWMQGGASLQFHTVVANLAGRNTGDWVGDYLVTGTWSKKAYEACIHANHSAHIINTEGSKKWTRSTNRLFTWVCTNETVDGIELDSAILDMIKDQSDTTGQPLLVADMSSNVFSSKMDLNMFDIIIAGAQKNIGCAGVTLVVCKTSLILERAKDVPTMLDYHTYLTSNSLYNTPPVYAIYVCGLVLSWLVEIGGIDWISKVNTDKAKAVYATLTKANHFSPIVKDLSMQSRMNVVFNVLDRKGTPSSDLESRFVLFAETDYKIVGLKGHRSVGGCRASLYNAVTLEQVNKLCTCIRLFDQMLDQE